MVFELRIACLGGLEITWADEPVTGFVSNKAPALLCYLAMTGRPHFRPALAGLLWGESPEAEALGSLRRVLSNLRDLVRPWLSVTRHTVTFNRQSPFWLDVDEFQVRIESRGGRPAHAPGPDLARLQEAIDLYRGDFLAGFYVRDAPAFEEWVALQRERLQELALQGLDTLIQHWTRHGDLAAALEGCSKMLVLAPWRESAHQTRMWLLARLGDRAAALAQYEACRSALARELGVEPGEATETLARRIRAAGLPRPNNLPAQTTSFVGRATELGRIVQLFDSGCRLVTLLGPGGIGKSRLALEAAGRLVTDKTGAFGDGIYLVPLAPLRSADSVPLTIAAAVNCPLQPGADPKAQLQSALRGKEVLLILDSFEPVLEGAPLVADLLAACPRLTVLATSRAPLHLSGEYRLPVPPLAGPDLAHLPPLAGLAHWPAVSLFMDRARAVAAELSLDDNTGAQIAGICASLDGLPLAIELAAARCGELTPGSLFDLLASRLDLLIDGPRDLPARQRTLRGTIAWSYDLLPAEEQSILAWLAAFAGGCTHEAAAAVCDRPAAAIQEALESLAIKSLLVVHEAADGERRFVMLDTIHEYALERLAGRSDQDAVRERHAAWFLALAEQGKGRRGPELAAWLDRMEIEHHNLLAALQWAVDRQAAELALRLSIALRGFWHSRGYVAEASRWLEAALAIEEPGLSEEIGSLEALPEVEDPHLKARVTRRIRALNGAAVMATLQGDSPRALDWLEESLPLMRLVDDQKEMAATLAWLGSIRCDLGDDEQARAYYEQSLEMARPLGPAGQNTRAFVHNALAELALRRGQYAEAQALSETGLALWRELDNEPGLVCALLALGYAAHGQGRSAEAASTMRRALSLAWEAQDRMHLVDGLAGLATVLATTDQAGGAALLLGQAEALRQAIGYAIRPTVPKDAERLEAGLRARLGEEAFAAAWAQGKAMALEEAVRYALAIG